MPMIMITPNAVYAIMLAILMWWLLNWLEKNAPSEVQREELPELFPMPQQAKSFVEDTQVHNVIIKIGGKQA